MFRYSPPAPPFFFPTTSFMVFSVIYFLGLHTTKTFFVSVIFN